MKSNTAVVGTMIAAFLLQSVTFGQVEAGAPVKEIRITGQVVDSSGAVISFATVALKSTGSEIVATTRTGHKGEFAFVAPANGSYQLLIEATGFHPVQKPVEAIAGQDVEVPVIVMNPLKNGPDLMIFADEPPFATATLCEIEKQPRKVNGKILWVRGSVHRSEEATVLFDRTCSGSILLVGANDKNLMNDKKYRTLVKHLKRHDVDVTVLGRFEYAPSRQFGHNNMFDCRFILISISDVVAKPIYRSADEKSKR